jgi:hypothetical protein
VLGQPEQANTRDCFDRDEDSTIGGMKRCLNFLGNRVFFLLMSFHNPCEGILVPLVVLLINFPKAAPSDNRSVGCL